MIRVKFLIDNSDYSNYKGRALENFNDFVRANDLKDVQYKNGTRKVWFNKSAWKYGKYLVKNMNFESIPLEVEGVK